MEKEKFKCKSIRLCRYLYSLGFNKESKIDPHGNEYWLFERSYELQESLSFFFSMRNKFKQELTKDEGDIEGRYKRNSKIT